MSRKRVVAYIIRSGEGRDEVMRREIEIQRDNALDVRTCRTYRRTPRRDHMIRRAAIIWEQETE